MGSESISGACNECVYAPVLATAQDKFDSQPSAFVSVRTVDGRNVSVRRHIEDEQLNDMISNPASTISQAETHLQEKPCTFVKTGVCELAKFLITKSANQSIS